jgi:hypothetical protein
MEGFAGMIGKGNLLGPEYPCGGLIKLDRKMA